MSLTVKLTQYFEVVDGSRTIQSGSSTPTSIVVDGSRHNQVVDVAASTTVKVFDVDEDIADFDFLWINSDQNVIVEFVTDDDGDVGESVFTMELTANVPFVLASDASYANYTVNFAGGTLDVIETIRVRNLGTTTASVEISAWT